MINRDVLSYVRVEVRVRNAQLLLLVAHLLLSETLLIFSLHFLYFLRFSSKHPNANKAVAVHSGLYGIVSWILHQPPQLFIYVAQQLLWLLFAYCVIVRRSINCTFNAIHNWVASVYCDTNMCTRNGIKIYHDKGDFHQKEDSCFQQIGLKYKEETNKVLH